MPVVAEGVETDQQLEFLRAEGCAEVQGFGVGRPAPLEALAAMIGGAELGVAGAARRMVA